jgi:ATP-dependent DNA ligase
MTNYYEMYKVDSTGKVRVFFIEQDGEKYRMVSGVNGGALVRSNWTVAIPKNLGRSNETSPTVQANLEILARYTKKKEEGYFANIEDARRSPNGIFFEPMLAETWEKVKPKDKQFPLIADPKLDGMRMTEDRIEVISRRGKDIKTAGHIQNDLILFFAKYPTVRLDGELYNHEFKDDFNELMSIARREKPDLSDLLIAQTKLQYHVYDMYDEEDPGMTAIERKHWLVDNLPTSDIVHLVPFKVVYSQEELDIVKGENLEAGYEGTITRAYNSIYENKRTKSLLKIKDFITEEFPLVSIEEGKGNRAGIAGNVIINVNGKQVSAGIRGSWDYCAKLLKNMDDYAESKATIRHFGKTPDGSLRFPVMIDVNRPD